MDGHDVDSLRTTIEALPVACNKPNLIICHTVKGKGVPEMENNPNWHHKSSVPAEEIQRLFQSLEGQS